MEHDCKSATAEPAPPEKSIAEPGEGDVLYGITLVDNLISLFERCPIRKKRTFFFLMICLHMYTEDKRSYVT